MEWIFKSFDELTNEELYAVLKLRFEVFVIEQNCLEIDPDDTVSLQSNDGEGKPGEEEPLHSDRQTLCQSEAIAASMSLCQHPCPLRRSAPDSPFCRFATSSPGRGKSFLKGRAFGGGIS